MEENSKVCSNCGSGNAEGAQFCRSCGTPFQEPAEEPANRSRKFLKWGGIGCGGLIGIIVIFAIISAIASSGEEESDTLERMPESAQSVELATQPTPEPVRESGRVKPGTHLVNKDIQPGQYRGEAGTGLLDSCYWARLSGTSGSFDELLANDNAVGACYVTVLPSDYALETACELRAVGSEAPSNPSSVPGLVPPGIHLVNKDIGSGQYRGEAGTDLLDSCYWARLSGTSGSFDELLANDNAIGVFYVTVLPSDYALETACELRKE